MFKKLFNSITKSNSDEQKSEITKTPSSENKGTTYKIGETIYPAFVAKAQKPYGFRVYDIKTGGMGIVYLTYGVDNYIETGKKSAIKTFQDWCFFEPEIVERFTREAEVWIKLGHHQNIVRALAVFKIDNRPYILLELVEGCDLRQILKSDSLSVEKAVKLARQFCLGMAHAQDVFPEFVHRDIKPENCLIANSGILKVTDFGLVKAIYTDQSVNISPTSSQETSFFKTQTGEGGIGTFPYMAPEQFEDFAQTNVRTDVYSFGVMFYEMLTGKRPFTATNPEDWYYHHKHTQPIAPYDINKSIPKLLSFWVMKCLEKNPSERLPDFKTIWLLLSATLSEQPKIKVAPATPKASESANSLAGKANSLHHLGKNQEALGLINQAIIISDSDWLYWGTKSRILNSLGKFEEALYCINKEISLNPTHKDSYINKIKLLKKLNRNEEAIKTIEDAINIFPKEARLYLCKADLLSEFQREKEANLAVNKAYDLNSKDSYVLFYKGMYLQRDEKFKESLNYIETALDLNSSNDSDWNKVVSNAWEMKGKALLILGKAKAAYNCFNKSLSINPISSEAMYVIGMMHLNFDYSNMDSRVEFDFDKGMYFLQKSADLGHLGAKEWIKKVEDSLK